MPASEDAGAEIPYDKASRGAAGRSDAQASLNARLVRDFVLPLSPEIEGKSFGVDERHVDERAAILRKREAGDRRSAG